MQRGLALGVIVITAGCLEPSLVPCGELACAPSQVCHADRCLDPSRLAACEGALDGATCDALDGPGRCIAGVCEAATCGDGYVDAELREECDGSVPDAHCVDFGYDIGRPACTECRSDSTAGCTRFGWERVNDAPTHDAWVDGATIAYLTTSELVVETPAGTTTVPGEFLNLHAATDRVIAYYAPNLVEVANGVATPKIVPFIEHARIGPDGTVFALDDCRVYTITDRFEPIGPAITGASVCAMLEIGPPDGAEPRIFVAGGSTSADRIYRWNAGRGQLFPVNTAGAPITEMRFHGDRLWVATTDGAYTLDDAGNQTTIALGFGPNSIAFGPDATFFADINGVIARVRGDRVQRFRAPGLITGDGEIYAYRGPLHRFTGTAWGTRDTLPPQFEVVASLRETDGSIVVASTSVLHISYDAGASWVSAFNPSGGNARAFTGGGDRYFMSGFTDDIDARAPTLHASTNTGSWATVAVPDDPLIYALWWSQDDDTLFAVGDNDRGDAFLGVRRGTMWETAYRTGCTVRGVHGTSSTHVIAVGGCGDRSVVWRYDGTQWTELESFDLAPPLAAVVAFDTGDIVVAGGAGSARFDTTSWSIDEGAVGTWLSGTSASDVWLSGTFTSVQHFDGASWSRLPVLSIGPIAVAAQPDRVMFPGAAEGFVELVR